MGNRRTDHGSCANREGVPACQFDRGVLRLVVVVEGCHEGMVAFRSGPVKNEGAVGEGAVGNRGTRLSYRPVSDTGYESCIGSRGSSTLVKGGRLVYHEV